MWGTTFVPYTPHGSVCPLSHMASLFVVKGTASSDDLYPVSHVPLPVPGSL